MQRVQSNVASRFDSRAPARAQARANALTPPAGFSQQAGFSPKMKLAIVLGLGAAAWLPVVGLALWLA